VLYTQLYHAGLATLHALLRYLDYQVCKIIYRFLIIAITFWKYFRAYNLNHFIYEMGNLKRGSVWLHATEMINCVLRSNSLNSTKLYTNN
jgi:hypothetical protein